MTDRCRTRVICDHPEERSSSPSAIKWEGMLEGTGRYMRHVKLRPVLDVDEAVPLNLIEMTYRERKVRNFRCRSIAVPLV
jgi:hypothetical protein